MSKKIIAILVFLVILLIGVAGFYFNLMSKQKEAALVPVDENVVFSETYEELMSRDYVNEYPADYLHLMDENNEIVMYQYGQEVIPQEAEGLIKKQRELFAKELLEMNPVEAQIEKYLKQLESHRELGRYIVSRKNLTTNVLAYDGGITEVKVEEAFSDGYTIQYNYYMIMEDGKWKIFSWDNGVTRYPETEEIEEK